MRIGVLSSQLGTPGGPATFDRRVLHEIASIDHENQYTIYALTKHAQNALQVTNKNFHIKPISPQGKLLGLAFGVAREMKRHPVDLLHASFVPPLNVPGKFVMTMTCWSQYSEPELYPPLVRWRLVYLLNRGIPHSSAMFCYTDFLKQKVIEKFRYDPERIFVTPPGIGDEMHRIEDQAALADYQRDLQIKQPYILFIGALTKRKNVHRLVEAYSRAVHEAQLPHHLVLVGEKLFDTSALDEAIEKSGLKDRIIFIGQRPHSELPWLYSGADAYIFPTLSEGFGLTPLEAMACGTPVVASNVTSVPEVVADAALLVDPLNVDDIAAGIQRVLTDNELRADMVRKGHVNAAKYSWQATAEKMIAAYATVLKAGW
jgi:glycosyltransferase involved in cell wall biosynthesis